MSALKLSANRCIPSTTVSNKGYIVPGWNEYVKEHHLHAKDALEWWNLNNRPQYGPIYDSIYIYMRTSKAHFKYVLRFIKNQEETAQADALARDLIDKDVDNFWKTVYKMNTSSNIQANVIDGITGPDNIADYWRQHFQKILNSNDCDISLKSNIMRKFEGIQHNPEMVVSTNCVSQIVDNLECGKSAGPDGICAEHFYLSSSDNQFGFKSCHSTDLCIYDLKEFIEYYKNRGTTVCVTFLDASKAFDRLNYWLLFDKLLKKQVPLFIIKLLCFWYTHQQCLSVGVTLFQNSLQ